MFRPIPLFVPLEVPPGPLSAYTRVIRAGVAGAVAAGYNESLSGQLALEMKKGDAYIATHWRTPRG